jgi:hypothetical protein
MLGVGIGGDGLSGMAGTVVTLSGTCGAWYGGVVVDGSRVT